MKADLVESLIGQVTEVTGQIGSINIALQHQEVGKALESSAPPQGIHPEAWKALQARIQRLKTEMQIFARHCGL